MSAATLSTVEAARILGRTRQCVRQWCEEGKIPAQRDDNGCYQIDAQVVYDKAKRIQRNPDRRYISIREAAHMLSLEPSEVRDLCERGHIGYIKLPGCPIRIEAAEVDRVVARYSKPAITTGRI